MGINHPLTLAAGGNQPPTHPGRRWESTTHSPRPAGQPPTHPGRRDPPTHPGRRESLSQSSQALNVSDWTATPHLQSVHTLFTPRLRAHYHPSFTTVQLNCVRTSRKSISETNLHVIVSADVIASAESRRRRLTSRLKSARLLHGFHGRDHVPDGARVRGCVRAAC